MACARLENRVGEGQIERVGWAGEVTSLSATHLELGSYKVGIVIHATLTFGGARDMVRGKVVPITSERLNGLSTVVLGRAVGPI